MIFYNYSAKTFVNITKVHYVTFVVYRIHLYSYTNVILQISPLIAFLTVQHISTPKR